MRHRFGVFLLATALSLASAPAQAAPVHDVAAHVAPAGPPVAVAAHPAAVESVHVYLIAQLTVPDSLGRDSLALRHAIARGVGAVIVTLQAERIPIHRGAIMLRDSNDDPAREILHRPIEPPNRASVDAVSRTPGDSAFLRAATGFRR